MFGDYNGMVVARYMGQEIGNELPADLNAKSHNLEVLFLSYNSMSIFPDALLSFQSLKVLDLSNNLLSTISDTILQLKQLNNLDVRNNQLSCESLPKDFGLMRSLKTVNFSANNFGKFPPQLTEIPGLETIYFGANHLEELPSDIIKITDLRVLYLGGNLLSDVPSELGFMPNLISLNLCDNKLTSLPSSFKYLRTLQSLSLHSNRLETLPSELLALELSDLSLRNNPLVQRFVEDLRYEVPSLLELSARSVRNNNLAFESAGLPSRLVRFLSSATRCINPNCKGVYFVTKVEHIKFMDFCGKYRLPLLQYLCSPQCADEESPKLYRSPSDDELSEDEAERRIRQVLLG